MMKYLNKRFSVYMGGSDQYESNWESIFGKHRSKIPQGPSCIGLKVCPYAKVDSPFLKGVDSITCQLFKQIIEPLEGHYFRDKKCINRFGLDEIYGEKYQVK